MVILQSPDGSYYIAPSPPSFYESPTPDAPSSSGGSSYQGPIQPGTSEEKFRETGGTTETQVLGQTITPGTIKKEQPFYFGEAPAKESYGVLTATPKEAESLKKRGVPYWEQEAKSPTGAIAEGSFAGRIPQKSGVVKTKGLYEYNIRNLIAGKQIYRQTQADITAFKQDPKSFEGLPGVITTPTEEGTSYELTPKFFEKRIDMGSLYSTSLVQAKEQFRGLPESKRRELSFKGYGLGVTSTVIGIGEFGGTMTLNLGYQTITPGEKVRVWGKSFRFGGELGKIRNYPTTQTTVNFLESPPQYTREKLTSPGFLGQATVIVPVAYQGIKSLVTNIKSYGWKGGLTETASGVLPVRIKSQIYSQPITAKTQFKNIKSVKFTDAKGITTRIYKGSSGNIKLYGVEKTGLINGKPITSGYSVTRTPTLEIRGGGSIVKEGVRVTVNPYRSSLGGMGTAYTGRGNSFFTQLTSPQIKGGTSNIISSKGVTIYATPEGATVYSNLAKGFKSTGGSAYKDIKPGLKQFTSGQAKPIYKTTFGDKRVNLDTGTATRDFVYSPTGRYRLNPKLSGVEYDINKINVGGGDKGFTSFKGGKVPGVSQLTKFDSGLSAVVPATKPRIFKSPTTSLPFQTTTKQDYPEQIFKQSTQTITTPRPKIKTDTEVISSVIPKITSWSGTRGKSKQIVVTVPKVDTIPKAKQKSETIQSPNIISVKKIGLKSSQDFTTSSSGYGYSQIIPSYSPTPIIPPPTFIPPFIAGGRSIMGLGNVKLKVSPVRYTPSFKALFFKVKGKAPTGISTGFRFRPITKGFSFQRKIRVRKIRI